MKKTQTGINAILAAVAASRLAYTEEEKKETSIDYAEVVQTAIKTAVVEEIENTSARSAWGKGVRDFAVDLFLQTAENKTAIEILSITEKDLLDGAEDWEQFSYGGRWLAYDHDIAESLCTPSEFKRKKRGYLPPNSHETWLDIQAQALYQASKLVLRTIRKIK